MTHLSLPHVQNQQQHQSEKSNYYVLYCYELQNNYDKQYKHDAENCFLIVSSLFCWRNRSWSETHTSNLVQILQAQKFLNCQYFFINNHIKMGCGAAHSAIPPSGRPNEVSPGGITLNKTYQKRQLIGKGTYGDVYRCLNKIDGKQYALKVVKLTSKTKQQAKRQINNLKSQISVLKKINHPNIVKYYSFDISQDEQTVQIVLQLVSQGTLKDYIKKRGPLQEDQAAQISRQILQGLKYLHQLSIMHRDLKCANILMNSEGTPKITDFGTAKQIQVNSNEDIAKLCASLKGTPYYMAPQILKRSGHFKSADIWSFGCTLIEMLTGKAPWTTLTLDFQQIISYIVSGIHPPLPPNISKQCQFFLQSCLDSVPSQRLTAQELLKHRFIDKNKQKQTSLVYNQTTELKATKKLRNQETYNKPTTHKEVHISELNEIQVTKKIKTKKNISELTVDTGQKNSIITPTNLKNVKKQLFQQDIQSNEIKRLQKQNGKYVPLTDMYIDQIYAKDIKRQKKSKQPSNRHVVAKTAGHVKMTEQNLTDWNQIQAEMINLDLRKNNRKNDQEDMMASVKSITDTPFLRSNTQNSIKEECINTTIARQERLKYLQGQKLAKKRKEEQKLKWQQQLHQGGNFLKKQISNRYIKN